MTERRIKVTGASQNNLRDIDVDIGPGLTAVVGVSGSGKSSLAFDTVYHEAHRRFLETTSLGAPAARMRPASVRSMDGLGPAVSIAQNVLNRNPESTVATAIGAHPFLRILFARFSEVACTTCGVGVRTLTDEPRLKAAQQLSGRVEVPLVRGVVGTHQRLLQLLKAAVGRDAVTVDGRPWSGRRLAADRPHDIAVTTGDLAPGAPAAAVRAALAEADAWGSHEVVVGGASLLRSPICPGCGAWVPPLPSTAFRTGSGVDTGSHKIAGLAIADVVARTPSEVIAFLTGPGVPPDGKRILDELTRRLKPLVSLGLGHIALDRAMPTLSRGESQRVRLAVVVAGRLEDLLHVLDEPSIGLHRTDMRQLFNVLAALPGPVVMVEHDAGAVATADDVIELGPGAGSGGGSVAFQGTPADLWATDTLSGDYFSGRVTPARRERRRPGDSRIRVTAAFARNLRDIDCDFPIGCLTAVTGPSGAGKTTLVRDVLLASIEADAPAECRGIHGLSGLRAIAVDQAPLGNNPRSNPATYTKVFDRIRNLFAAATGESVSTFTFNRAEGACPVCEGMGAVEVSLRFLASTWVECDACAGARYRPEVLQRRATFEGRELTVADALALSVDEARSVFGADRSSRRILDALADVGLGYLTLGQPSPTLSGGEAQRVRLARQLARARPGDVVLLDEPTTGLHPADLDRLVSVLDGLTAAGSTVIVVEHQPDVVNAADWIVELGPGGGPDGGQLMHCGPARTSRAVAVAPRGKPRSRSRSSDLIQIRGARANNLRGVNVDIPKGKFTAVTGVSGSGKSSLVRDVLEAEAMRRLLESLSMYERQGTREGPEAPVRSLTGLGPTLVLGATHRWSSGYAEGLARPAATVGWASGLSRSIAVILARAGSRSCLECGGPVGRENARPESPWRCHSCGASAVPIEPRHLNAQTPIAACPRCIGLGSIRRGDPDRLVVKPHLPICGGALHSPGYFPKGYLCTEGTGGYYMLQALAGRHGFDPSTTPWNEMSPEARHAFLHGDDEPLHVEHRWGAPRQQRWSGVLTGLSQWDQGGLYTTGAPCPTCNGKRLRPEYLAITLGGYDRTDLHSLPLVQVESTLREVGSVADELAEEARSTTIHRAGFLARVGLGYLHLDRLTGTLSAGEAQRVKLASVLGSGLLGMTILLDEPTRGLHPREVGALTDALEELRTAGNTIIAVEHDGVLLSRADHVIEIGPKAGSAGGRVVYQGAVAKANGATGEAITGSRRATRKRRSPDGWMEITGATEHNLMLDRLAFPLGVLAGVCGVSGSGKSTLMVDTVGLALAPPKLTTSVAMERYEPGVHEAISGAPARTIVADQSRSGITSPGHYLGLVPALRRCFAQADDAVAAGLTEKDFGSGCDACTAGQVVEAMGFLPPVTRACDACEGTGYRAEVRAVVARGRTLAEVEQLTVEELGQEWGDVALVGRACDAAGQLGIGYLVVRQPGSSLSGGEAQRLKLARELAKKSAKPSLYLLDEPTVGLHVRDVEVLASALDAVVDAGHSVIVVEHDPNLLARCDWLVELGPGGGPDGGRVIAEGTPEDLAALDTPTAPFLRKVLA